jgi:hypothetical protein
VTTKLDSVPSAGVTGTASPKGDGQMPIALRVRSWETSSVDVRWRPLLWVVIVTHLVTRTLASRASLAEADIARRYYVSAGLDITPYKQRQSNWGPE